MRERGEDLLALAEHFLKLNCDKIGKPCLSFSDESSQLIQQYRWPGNIRELQNAIQRAVILCEHAIIPPDLLAIDMEGPGVNPDVESIPEDLSLEDYFLKFVLANQERMTETELAQKLGISRKTLYEKRQKLDVPRERSKKRGS